MFEICNLENAQEFTDANWQAFEGKCTRMKYVRKYAALEHLALGKVQRFYKDVWTPWCQTTGFVSNVSVWRHGYDPTFEIWLSRFPPDSRYPWSYYGENYDSLKQEAEKKAQESKPLVK